MDKLDDLLYQYWKKFNEGFPIMLTKQMQTKELIETLEKCIKNNVKYDAGELDANADY